jgi:hypothetical protein
MGIMGIYILIAMNHTADLNAGATFLIRLIIGKVFPCVMVV